MPADLTPLFDPARRALARQYEKSRRRAFWAHRAVDAAWVAGLLAWPLGPTLSVATAAVLGPGMTQTAAFAALLTSAYAATHAAIAFLFDYRPAQRFGLVTSRPMRWARDRLIAGGLGAMLAAAWAVLTLGLLRRAPHLWPWLLAIAAVAFDVLAAFALPVVILPLFYRLRPVPDPTRRARLDRLAASARAGVSRIDVIDLSSRLALGNAAVLGIGRTRRIVVADTLIAAFPPDEVEAVVAHELGHQREGHLWWAITAGAAERAAVFWLTAWAYPAVVRWFGQGRPTQLGNLPLLAVTAALFTLVLRPGALRLSRHLERRADAFALRMSDDPAAFGRALIRLADQNLAEIDPPRWRVFWSHTHPPLGERIRKALGGRSEKGRDP